ncbi:tRNA epoxyqueuosine(34) reductase QueG [Salisediminibacterium beveridgei]|uniref:Iron-sulfur cluster-binding protein n=1 Tax=Salisediminibacterium beveridgei TaxID=632773 RepID=A0A1D7QWS9_9BACI|nr:tRNA epoxyqueuosine(34) reductase QueG [Salisediminibacterium beveridgei]AOM83462.1 Iron-sulfur cluster-binding protein [Salisediminibacterium beveridgei]
MKASELKNKLIEKSRELEIDKIGFASADPFVTLKSRLEDQQSLGFETGFEKGSVKERTEPERLLPEAKTIVSIAMAYPSKLKNPPRSVKGDRRGVFCRASWGEDYHHILKRKLKALEAYLHELMPDERTAVMVDTGELSDRAVAERAGIGWSAKNCAIITPEFGSYVYLGEMLMTAYVEPDTPLEDQCGSCTKCIDACPTDALIQGGQLDSSKCIAYLTLTKSMIPKEYRQKLGNRLYGCDTCQVVCPENKGKNHTHHEEMTPDPEKAKPQLIPLLSLSNKEFKRTFGEVSGSWRGKKPIQRNALIALANFKDVSAVPAIEEVLKNDQRPVMRATAAWALSEIKGDEAMPRLEAHLDDETADEVIAEIADVMKHLSRTTRL